MDAEKTLKTAYLTVKSNNKRYGAKKESFELIAKLSTLMTGKELTSQDCCMVLMALKLSREKCSHKDDNMVDLCGYASILNELYHGEGK